jgi:hypothetical protein
MKDSTPKREHMRMREVGASRRQDSVHKQNCHAYRYLNFSSRNEVKKKRNVPCSRIVGAFANRCLVGYNYTSDGQYLMQTQLFYYYYYFLLYYLKCFIQLPVSIHVVSFCFPHHREPVTDALIYDKVLHDIAYRIRI